MAASPPPLPVAHFSNNTHEPSSSPPYSSSRSTVLAVSSRAALKTKTCAVFSRYTQVDTRGHDRAAAQNFCTVLRLLLTTVLKPLSDASSQRIENVGTVGGGHARTRTGTDGHVFTLDVRCVFFVFRNDLETQCILCIQRWQSPATHISYN
jgi:hypothetical protein